MKFKLAANSKEYEVEITETGGQTKVTVSGKEFLFPGNDSAGVAAVPQAFMPKRDLSNKEIRASLAGTITEINAKPGDIVKAGQKLLTLSAMKMENEILSECDGKVKEVKVAKDQKVKDGDILITLA